MTDIRLRRVGEHWWLVIGTHGILLTAEELRRLSQLLLFALSAIKGASVIPDEPKMENKIEELVSET